jgi:hypothetical protein
MGLLAPFALLLSALVPVVVAMYLLKLRREERTVASTFLWQRMVRDVEANAPWQKLRRNLLLLLQLLTLLALIFALARPYVATTGISGHNLILIVDRSASMAATDVGGRRLDEAKREAIRLIDQLPDTGRATVIAFGGRMEVPVSASADRRELRAAINGLQIRNGGGSDLSQALAFAGALAAQDADSEVAIISDGQVQAPPQAKIPATVRFFPIGNRADNVAISALALQRAPGGQRLFAQATNYGPGQVKRRLIVELDGQLFNAYDLTLDPAAEQSVVADVPAAVRVAVARFEGSDALPTDDRAWAVGTSTENANVRLLSDGNPYLEAGLATLPGLQVTRMPTTTTTFTDTAALTVLDGVVPNPLPPGNLLFVGPLRSSPIFSVTGQLEYPTLRPVAGGDPLLQNVSLAEVSVLRAAQIPKPAWAHTVIDSDGGPVLLAGEESGRRVGVLSFALHESDLPLQVAFPILLSNVVGYLAPGQGGTAAALQPGQPLVVPVPPDTTGVRVTPPGGSPVTIKPANGQAVFAGTDALGVYKVEITRPNLPAEERSVAANLMDAGESRVEPRKQLPIVQVGGRGVAANAERSARSEFWRWLAAIALAILVAEWLVYQRPALALLRDRWRRRRAGPAMR